MKTDLQLYAGIFNQEGTSRPDRYSADLNPDNLKIDDRQLPDFILFAQRYAKNIRFIPLDGAASDEPLTWEKFFADESVLHASIIEMKAATIKEDYDFLFHQFRENSTLQHFQFVLEFVMGRFERIDRWYSKSRSNGKLRGDLETTIRSALGSEWALLQQIVSQFQHLSADAGSRKELRVFTPADRSVWESSGAATTVQSAALFAGLNEREKLYSALIYVNRVFETIFRITSGVMDTSTRYFRDQIFDEQTHEPHITLFITFVKLFEFVQADFNKLPHRMLEYYYKSVLKIRPKPQTPDRTHVVFEIAKGVEEHLLEKGTALVAGKDSKKQELRFYTDKELIVTKAKVAAVRTLLIDQYDGLATRYICETIKRNGQFADDRDPQSSWGPFGDAQKGMPSRTGVAISSSQLYLGKGERNVTITFQPVDGATPPEFPDYDINAITLAFTAEKSWIYSDNGEDHITVRHLKRTAAGALELAFNISIAQASSVVAYDAAIHGGGFKGDFPIMQLLLNFPNIQLFPGQKIAEERLAIIRQLNDLALFRISGAVIDVHVGGMRDIVSFDGIRDLQVENHEGQLEVHKPFFPFTTMPKVGSSFYVGGDDLYYKKIDAMHINVEWLLPDNFRSYYDKYYPPYDANEFNVSLSLLKDHNWQKIDDYKIIDCEAQDPKFTLLRMPASKLANLQSEGEILKFDNSHENGTIRLKLKYPDFGHGIYAQLITATVMEKSTSKLATVDFYNIVKKQLADSVISVKLPPPGDPNYFVPQAINTLRQDLPDEQIKVMLTELFTNSLVTYNQVNVDEDKIDAATRAVGTSAVNDDNFLERILRFLRKVKLIDRNIHFDQDKDSIQNVVEDVNDTLNKRIDFLLPAAYEMVRLIVSEVQSAIRRVLRLGVEKLVQMKSSTVFDEAKVTQILTKEINDANLVINDMIAKKIATLLSAQDVPPKPYTPQINTISISYTSSKVLQPGEDRVFHVLPIGVAETNPFYNSPGKNKERKGLADELFPRSVITDDASQPGSGVLFVGLKDVSIDHSLALFFEVDDSVSKSDLKPTTPAWFYLMRNQWQRFSDDQIISDTTFGLQASGIIEFSFPSSFDNNSAIFDEVGLFWICASVPGNAETFPHMFDVCTNAVAATYKDNGNDPMRLASPLAPGKLTKLVEEDTSISKVVQPVASSGGKLPEREEEYYSRVSERLRHKGRAITSWDYERLVLEKFPSVYKVKCLNNYAGGGSAAGHVTIVPVMSQENRTTGKNRSELSRANYLQLKEIGDYLRNLSTPFAKIHVVNPVAEYVMITCKVRFVSGVDKGYYVNRLNEELVAFLTPWAGAADALLFSNKIYASSIINFIDKRPYVDYVADLSMRQYLVTASGSMKFARLPNQTIDLSEAQASTPQSILVSVSQHVIDLLDFVPTNNIIQR